MVQHIVYESRDSYVFRNVVGWCLPVFLILISLSALNQGKFDWSGLLVLSSIWLGVLIYFKFYRKKKKR